MKIEINDISQPQNQFGFEFEDSCIKKQIKWDFVYDDPREDEH